MQTVLPRSTSSSAGQPQEPMLVALRDAATDRHTVEWAAQRAAHFAVPLTLLHAVADPSLVAPGTSYEDEVMAGRELVTREAERIRRRYPGLHLGTYLHCGEITEALLGMSAAAPLLVVGADRRDPVSGAFAGSVAVQVALNASAPVVVVPAGQEYSVAGGDRRGVVVGVDGSEVSRATLARAADEADAAGTVLTAVTVLGSPPERMKVGASTMLRDVTRRHPALPVRWVVDDLRTPLSALALLGRGAALLVIGRHGKGARSIMGLGTVTHTLLLDPPCPTLVVTRREPGPSAGGPARETVRRSAH